MAKIEELIPFVLYFEVGLTKSELNLEKSVSRYMILTAQ